MVYVALLRGVNVGGKGTVSMSSLAEAFVELGFQNVKTYINSGNVVFKTKATGEAALAKRIQSTLENDFGVKTSVHIRNLAEMRTLLRAIPPKWANDQASKCDVWFLAKEIDKPAVLKEIPANPEIEVVKYAKGAVLWFIERKFFAKSRIPKIIGTPLYKSMTIRNVNTVRKLLELMEAAQSA